MELGGFFLLADATDVAFTTANDVDYTFSGMYQEDVQLCFGGEQVMDVTGNGATLSGWLKGRLTN